MNLSHETKIALLLIKELPQDPFLILLGKKGVSRRLIPQISNCGYIGVQSSSEGELVGILLASKPREAGLVRILLRPSLFFQFIANIKNFYGFLEAASYYLIKPKLVENFEILWIAVSSDKHGQGIGSKLIFDLMKYCESRSIEEVSVKTLLKTPQNVKFYEKNGFSEVLKIKGRSFLSRKVRGSYVAKQ